MVSASQAVDGKTEHPSSLMKKDDLGLKRKKKQKKTPKWCWCRTAIAGPMVKCGNNACNIQWFHFRCVGITQEDTKGEWYCTIKCESEA